MYKHTYTSPIHLNVPFIAMEMIYTRCCLGSLYFTNHQESYMLIFLLLGVDVKGEELIIIFVFRAFHVFLVYVYIFCLCSGIRPKCTSDCSSEVCVCTCVRACVYECEPVCMCYILSSCSGNDEIQWNAIENYIPNNHIRNILPWSLYS